MENLKKLVRFRFMEIFLKSKEEIIFFLDFCICIQGEILAAFEILLRYHICRLFLVVYAGPVDNYFK